jgi:kinesin family protein 13
MEKLDLKLIDMRELYDELKSHGQNAVDLIGTQYANPFSESEENHSLIGVANIFLSVLFHDVNLDYHTPIISQQAEVAGRLQVQVQRVSGTFAQDHNSDCSDGSKSDDENPMMTIQVSKKQSLF